MAEQYVLGIDGGGTKTDFFLFTGEGKFVAHHRGGCVNHEGLEDGFAGTERELDAGITALTDRIGIGRSQIGALVGGLAGCDVPSQFRTLDDMATRLGFTRRRIFNDSFLGIKAGIPCGYGVCVVNGTGTVAGGIDRHGDWRQVGGCGLFLGDEAGGGHMAGMVIRRVHDELFRLGQPTSMTPRLRDLLGNADADAFIEDVYARFYSDSRLRVQTKEILGILFDEGNRGDAVALGLLRHTGEQMAHSAAGCIARLDFGPQVEIVLVGSVNLKATCPAMLDAFRETVERLSGKSCRLIPLDVPPATGAVLWALELLRGVPVDADIRSGVIAAVGGVLACA